MAAHNAPPPAGPALALLATLAGCGGAAEGPPPRPSVLLVVADSLHARHLGAWGHGRDTSPRVDALAREGLRFEQAYSQSSWTLPSVASLLTSLEQERHGLRTLEGTLPDEPDTLAGLFARAGWRTHAVVQTPVLGSARGLRRGFEGYRVLPFGNEASDEAVERTVGAFEAADGAPLFAYLHLAPPHMPYQPPDAWRGRFSAGLGGDPAVDGSIASCRGAHELRLAPDHPDVLRLAALYDEHVAYADACVGRLLDGLQGLPSAQDLLVVLTSDHGEAFLQHGAQGHNAQVYEEMLHVPLVVAGRGRVTVAPGVVEEPVSLLDLLPTLVDLLDLPAPRQSPQGRSLAPTLRGQPLDLTPRALFFSSRYRRRPGDLELGLREGDLKLVLSGDGARCELYDLAADPHEREDLAAARPEDAARMRARLRAWHDGRAPEAPPGPDLDEPGPERDALRALGY